MGDTIKVRDIKSGRRYTISYEGEPPTQAELLDIFNQKAGRSDIQEGLTNAYAPSTPKAKPREVKTPARPKQSPQKPPKPIKAADAVPGMTSLMRGLGAGQKPPAPKSEPADPPSVLERIFGRSDYLSTTPSPRSTAGQVQKFAGESQQASKGGLPSAVDFARRKTTPAFDAAVIGAIDPAVKLGVGIEARTGSPKSARIMYQDYLKATGGDAGAAGRAFSGGLAPAAGSYTGFSGGATLGSRLTPGPAPLKALGGFAGGMLGAFGGGSALAQVQEWVDKGLMTPDVYNDLVANRAKEQKQNKTAVSLGQAATALPFANFNTLLRAPLRERLGEGGVEVLGALGENWITGKPIDAMDLFIQAASGAALPGENRFGRVFTGGGARGANMALDAAGKVVRPQPKTFAPPPARPPAIVSPMGSTVARVKPLVDNRPNVPGTVFKARESAQVSPVVATESPAMVPESLPPVAETVAPPAVVESAANTINLSESGWSPDPDTGGFFKTHQGKTVEVVADDGGWYFVGDGKELGPFPAPEMAAEAGGVAPESRTQKAEVAGDVEGFLKGKTPMAAGKTKAALSKSVNIAGEIGTAAESIERELSNGATVSRDASGRRSLMLSDGRFVPESTIGKTAMDYAEYIAAKYPATPLPEPAPAAESPKQETAPVAVVPESVPAAKPPMIEEGITEPWQVKRSDFVGERMEFDPTLQPRSSLTKRYGPNPTPEQVATYKKEQSAWNKHRNAYKKDVEQRNTKWREHRSAVESALSEGKPVPAEVLADYPDLSAKYPTAPTPLPEPAPVAEAPKQEAAPVVEVVKDSTYTPKEGNPFAARLEKARRESQKYGVMETATDAATRESFPLGAGSTGRKQSTINKSIDASVDRAVAAVKASEELRSAESAARLFDEGKINAQGRAASAPKETKPPADSKPQTLLSRDKLTDLRSNGTVVLDNGSRIEYGNQDGKSGVFTRFPNGESVFTPSTGMQGAEMEKAARVAAALPSPEPTPEPAKLPETAGILPETAGIPETIATTPEPAQEKPEAPKADTPSAQLLKIETQAEIAKDLAAAGVNVADWTERGDLKHTFGDRFKAAADNYDALSQAVRSKQYAENPGIISEEESIIAVRLQAAAAAKVREFIDIPNRTGEQESEYIQAVADVYSLGRLVVRSGAQAGASLNFIKALFEDAPGGLIRAVTRAEDAAGHGLSPQAQQSLMAIAARGEALREQIDQAREARAEAEVEAFVASSPTRAERRVSDPTKKGYGNDNTIFTREKYEAAKAKIAASATRLNSVVPGGIDPDIAAALIDMGGYHFEAGLRKFSAWAKQVRSDVGGNLSDAVMQSTWLDVRAEAAERRDALPRTAPPRPSVFVEVLETRLGRDNARGFLEAIAEADGEPVLLQKLLDGSAISPEDRKRIANAYRANSPQRKRGAPTPQEQALASILSEFRKKSGYRPKPQTDAQARQKATDRLKGIEATGKPTAFKPRRVNPLISTATAEYAKGARSLDAWARAVENRIGESLPEDTKAQLFRDAVKEYMKETKPLDEIKAQLTKRIDAELLKTQSPIIQAAKRLQENNRKAQTLKATFDDSFFGRQGGKIVTARPDIGARVLKSLFVDRVKDKEGMIDWSRSVDAKIKATAGEYGGENHFKDIGLEFTESGQEEGTSGVNLDGPFWSLLRKMGIDASEAGNRGILNYLRLEYFKTLAKPTDPIEYQQAMANLVNIMSGRGMVKSQKLREKLNVMADSGVWSPRGNISNVQWITGADMAGTLLDAAKVSKLDPRAAEKKAAYRRALARQLGERLRYAATWGTAMGLLKALADSQRGDEEDSLRVDMNPRSKDFGKIRHGMNEYDTLAGARKHVAFFSEMLGIRQPSEFDLKPGQGGGSWKAPRREELAIKYGRSMVNPMVGNLLDIILGKDFKGSPVKVAGLQDGKAFFDPKEASYRAVQSVTPILVGAWADAVKEQSLTPQMAQAIAKSMPFDYMGIGTSIRDREAEPMKRAREKERGAGFVPLVDTPSALLSGKTLPTVKPGREATTLELKARVLDAMVRQAGSDPASEQGKQVRRRLSGRLSGASPETLRALARQAGL